MNWLVGRNFEVRRWIHGAGGAGDGGVPFPAEEESERTSVHRNYRIGCLRAYTAATDGGFWVRQSGGKNLLKILATPPDGHCEMRVIHQFKEPMVGILNSPDSAEDPKRPTSGRCHTTIIQHTLTNG